MQLGLAPGHVRPAKVSRILSLLIVLGLIAALFALFTIGRASALTAPIQITSNVNLMPGASSSSGSPLATIPAGTSPDFNCWAQGQLVNGVDVWFNVRYGGQEGYYASYYDNSSYSTDWQITSKYGIPPCSATPVSSPYMVAYTGGDGVALRYAPTATAKVTPLVVLPDGTPLNITCQSWSSDGSGAGPRDNRIFDNISSPDSGWVPDAYVSGTAAANQFTPGIPQCSAAPTGGTGTAMAAISFATARLGQNYDNGYCLRFVGSAYQAAGLSIRASSSAGAVQYWNSDPEGYARHARDTDPSTGALVFWGATRSNPFGHVGIYLGNNEVISTSSWPEPTSNPDVHVWSFSGRNAAGYPYLGWLMP